MSASIGVPVMSDEEIAAEVAALTTPHTYEPDTEVTRRLLATIADRDVEIARLRAEAASARKDLTIARDEREVARRDTSKAEASVAQLKAALQDVDKVAQGAVRDLGPTWSWWSAVISRISTALEAK